MVAHLHEQMGYFLLNYVDDFLGAEYDTRIWESHGAFVRLLRDIEVDRSEKKSAPPCQIIDFIGTLFNAIDMTIGVMQDRKVELMKELNRWRYKVHTTRRELETLIGKLQFVSNCVRLGRLFVSRLLSEMKAMTRGKHYKVTGQARKDIMWWYNFLPGFQGRSIMWLLEVTEIDTEFAVDACMIGAGGVAGEEYYRTRFPPQFNQKKLKITHLELWAVIVAVRGWGDKLYRKVVKIRSDNEAVATIINTGRSQDLYLQSQLRELCWWLAHFQCKVKSVHLSGRLNRIPDLLSRWHEGEKIRSEFDERTRNKKMVRRYIDSSYFNFQHTW